MRNAGKEAGGTTVDAHQCIPALRKCQNLLQVKPGIHLTQEPEQYLFASPKFDSHDALDTTDDLSNVSVRVNR